MAGWGHEGNLPKEVGLVGASQLPSKAEDDLVYLVFKLMVTLTH